MTPESSLFEVQDIPNAGRGVIARCHVPDDSLILESGPPAFSVSLNENSKVQGIATLEIQALSLSRSLSLFDRRRM